MGRHSAYARVSLHSRTLIRGRPIESSGTPTPIACRGGRFRLRIRVGADADIVAFDPARVIDRATFTDPALPSEGFAHVLVQGRPVIRDGQLQTGVYPGRGVRGQN